MTAAIYFVCCVMVAGLTTRAYLLDRDDPARRAFVGLGWSLAVGWMAFAVSLLPGADVVRGLWTVAGAVAPAYAYRTVDLLFSRTGEARPLGRHLIPLAWTAGLLGATAHLFFAQPTPHTSWPERFTGLVAAGLVVVLIRRLQEARRTAVLVHERTRLNWLLAATLLGVLLCGAEWTTRNLWAPATDAGVPFLERGLTLQGPVPPVSPVLLAWSVYFIHHVLQTHRLVALQEVLARMTVLGAAAGVLLLLSSLTLGWVELARFPLHGGFLLFLVSTVFLSVYTAARRPMLRLASRLFHREGEALHDALRRLKRTLPQCLRGEEVAEQLVDTLFASDRFGGVGVWLFDPTADAYRLTAAEGLGSPLESVRDAQFVDALRTDPHLGLERARLGLPPTDPSRRAQLEIVDALRCDLVLPFLSGDLLYGWLALRDEAWSDGFSAEERTRFAKAVEGATLVLSNVERFQRLHEERRLAQLGAMSAGLAHEIRNPLAGLKGAAQVLQGAELSGDDGEMLEVIVDEVGRLDRVVSGFLTFARPFHLHTSPTRPVDLVQHALRLVRAEGIDGGITLDVALDDDLPIVDVDGGPLTQVLLNLIRNALDAVGAHGTVKVTASVGRDRAGQPMVELAVVDDGPGVSEEALAQLFTPFFTTKDDGTGLGLAISERLVDAHGGELEHRVPPGGGAAFVVRLPAQPAVSSSDVSSSSVRESLTERGSEPAPGT